MLSRLMRDHKHIVILLRILTKKRTMLENGDSVNFNLVRDIVEYMQSYAEHSHHPLEDVIYEYGAERLPEVARLGRLSAEHQQLITSSGALMATLNLILSDVVVARDKLISDLSHYIAEQEEHMLFEERELFPLLAKHLNESDWQEIHQRCQISLKDDPLFADNDSQLFGELKSYLAQSD